MDNSKEYIKMCDCPEIQQVQLASKYERWSTWISQEILFAGNALPNYFALVWLPHQDQLQGMYNHLLNCVDKLVVFYRFVARERPEYGNTMEQLWLAFVMWELHKKKWDGNKWVKEEVD